MSYILIVEDMPRTLEAITRMVEACGWAARGASDGQTALAAAVKEPPALILLDVNMKGWDGYETCKRFKSNPVLKDIPVVFISALSDTRDKVKAFRAGGADYITKPVELEELEARVRTHLDLRGKRLEAESMSRRLRELELLRDNLLHMIVHEVRSQTGVISVSLELFKELSPDLSADALRMIKTAHDCARKVFQMITQLVDIGRFEANQMPLKREKIDLVKTAKAAIESLTATFSGWAPALQAPKALEAICDEEMIGRVIENLLANALKFTPPAQEVKLIISRHGCEAQVAVVDQGPGIPPEFHQRIFETFSHADAGAKRYGAGPGLAYSKLAIEAHGGKMGVESRPGYGSRFWFTLPVGEAPGTNIQAPAKIQGPNSNGQPRRDLRP